MGATTTYDERDIRITFNHIAWCALGVDACKKVTDLLADDVIEDVKACSNFPNDFNNDDVRLAFGRALCRRLGLNEDQ